MPQVIKLLETYLGRGENIKKRITPVFNIGTFFFPFLTGAHTVCKMTGDNIFSSTLA